MTYSRFDPYATAEGVRAWCYLMGEMRLFKFSQIEAVKEIDSGCDIKARGLWDWCGLPDAEGTFADELPGALKQSPWPESPVGPRFRVQFLEGAETACIDVSPIRWAEITVLLLVGWLGYQGANRD